MTEPPFYRQVARVEAWINLCRVFHHRSLLLWRTTTEGRGTTNRSTEILRACPALPRPSWTVIGEHEHLCIGAGNDASNCVAARQHVLHDRASHYLIRSGRYQCAKENPAWGDGAFVT